MFPGSMWPFEGGASTNLGRTLWLSVPLLMSVLVVRHDFGGSVAPTYCCNGDDYVIRTAHSIQEKACVKSEQSANDGNDRESDCNSCH
jgi:hypothetical protein